MNSELKKAQLAAWRLANPEYSKNWHRDHPDYSRDQTKKWRGSNLDRARANTRRTQSSYSKTIKGKAVAKKFNKKRRDKRRAFIDAVKIFYGCKNPDCKWTGTFEACCLDFHHVDPTLKVFQIGSTNKSMIAVLAEVSKCTVLCAMCHRLVTWRGLDVSSFGICVGEEVSLLLR